MLFKRYILLMYFMLFLSGNGLKQTLFKLTLNHGFQNMSVVFKTVKATSLLKCSLSCAHNDECRTSLFNPSDQSCSMCKSCEIEIIPTAGNAVIQNCPVDCSEIPTSLPSGIYTINPMVKGLPYETEVFCDMDGGGWTVMQRRSISGVSFNRTFDEYKNGFGDKSSDHWLGNELLHHILSGRNYSLRIELEDLAGNVAFAEYDSFSIGNETNDFILSISGYSGNAGDSLTDPSCNGYGPNPLHVLNGVKFSAVDRDNDNCPGCKCSFTSGSGWWLNWCSCGDLNTLKWNSWVVWGQLKSALMKIRVKQ